MDLLLQPVKRGDLLVQRSTSNHASCSDSNSGNQTPELLHGGFLLKLLHAPLLKAERNSKERIEAAGGGILQKAWQKRQGCSKPGSRSPFLLGVGDLITCLLEEKGT